jgi:ABC-type multidrug transport system fused ATPase/permease subunit
MRKIDQASNHENSQIQTSPYQKNIRLEFFNISYYVNSSAKYKLQSCKVWHEQRKILSDISGVVEPGDLGINSIQRISHFFFFTALVALMGSSGAGKSTLLNSTP